MGCSQEPKTLILNAKKNKDKWIIINDNEHEINIYRYILPMKDYELDYELKEENVVGYDNDNDKLIDLICPICLNILNHPKSCSSNVHSHSFCKKCINKFMATSNKCPLCKQNFENINNDKINEILYKMNFKCIYNAKGCGEIINYLNYSEHLKVCQYSIKTLYECQVDRFYYSLNNFDKCHFIGNYDEMINHFKFHEIKLMNCAFCSEIISRINSKEHYQNKCNIEILNERNGYKHIKKKDDSFGIYYFISGEKFKGSLNGWGQYYYLNGNQYEGEMINGYVDGYGKLYSFNGDKFEGEFKYDMNGYGICIYSNGEKYEGKWKYSQKNGIGKLYKKNKEIYYGEFKKDKIEGYGIYIYSNGEKYEGEWKNNVREGYGILYKLKGIKIIGKWKNNKLLKTIRINKDKLKSFFDA